MTLTYRPYLGKTVVFCLPGSHYSGRFLVSFTQLLDDCRRAGMKPIMSQDYSSMVNFARCKVAGANVKGGKYQKPFGGKVPYDYMMWIDSDIVFTSKDFFSNVLLFFNIVFVCRSTNISLSSSSISSNLFSSIISG